MRMTNLFSQTLREAPADAEAMSHILLLRAGFIRQLGSGIFSYLPLAKRTLDKIEGVIREEMDAIGGHLDVRTDEFLDGLLQRNYASRIRWERATASVTNAKTELTAIASQEAQDREDPNPDN